MNVRSSICLFFRSPGKDSRRSTNRQRNIRMTRPAHAVSKRRRAQGENFHPQPDKRRTYGKPQIEDGEGIDCRSADRLVGCATGPRCSGRGAAGTKTTATRSCNATAFAAAGRKPTEHESAESSGGAGPAVGRSRNALEQSTIGSAAEQPSGRDRGGAGRQASRCCSLTARRRGDRSRQAAPDADHLDSSGYHRGRRSGNWDRRCALAQQPSAAVRNGPRPFANFSDQDQDAARACSNRVMESVPIDLLKSPATESASERGRQPHEDAATMESRCALGKSRQGRGTEEPHAPISPFRY